MSPSFTPDKAPHAAFRSSPPPFLSPSDDPFPLPPPTANSEMCGTTVYTRALRTTTYATTHHHLPAWIDLHKGAKSTGPLQVLYGLA